MSKPAQKLVLSTFHQPSLLQTSGPSLMFMEHTSTTSINRRQHPSSFSLYLQSHLQHSSVVTSTAETYPNTNEDVSLLSDWAELNNFHLVFDSKDSPMFFSHPHKSWPYPDLTFVSSSPSTHCWRTILGRFPRSGHCPIIVSSAIKIKVSSIPKNRWDFRKDDWISFSRTTDRLAEELPPPHLDVSKAFAAFTNLLHQAAKQTIPRGRRYHLRTILG